MLIAEMLFEVLVELARAVAALDLAVAEHVAHRQQRLLQELQAKPRVLARPVVAVGKVERIDIPLRRASNPSR